MTSFKTLGAAAVLSMMIATPVFAQAAIDEPGEYSFYHPGADVLNAGPGPAAAMTATPFAESHASVSMTGNGPSCAHYRSYDPATGTFRGRDGVRHSCQ
jgi:hypothetical protein